MSLNAAIKVEQNNPSRDNTEDSSKVIFLEKFNEFRNASFNTKNSSEDHAEEAISLETFLDQINNIFEKYSLGTHKNE